MLLQYIFLSGGCSEMFIDTANALCCLQIGLKKNPTTNKQQRTAPLNQIITIHHNCFGSGQSRNLFHIVFCIQITYCLFYN